MFKNCSKKIVERYSELSKSMTYKLEAMSRVSALDELETVLQNNDADLPAVSGGADNEASGTL
jgi:hypothetical protein